MSFISLTVTFCATPANDLTCPPLIYYNLKPSVLGAILDARDATVRRAVCDGIVAFCAAAGPESGARGLVLAHIVSPAGLDVAVAKGTTARGGGATVDADETLVAGEFILCDAPLRFMRILLTIRVAPPYACLTALLVAAAFFALLEQLLRDARESELAASRDAIGAQRLARLALDRNVVERSSSAVDFVLQGLLHCLTALLARGDAVADAARSTLVAPLAADGTVSGAVSSFATRLFHRGLFAAPLPPPVGAGWAEGDLVGALPLCKSRTTRNIAFRALREMCGEIGAEGWAQVAACIVARHALERGESQRGVADDSQRFGATSSEVAAHGYVGVRNLGCICYMNATNQQLFMVPSFRRALLGARTSSSAAAAADAEEEDVLVEMQRLMGCVRWTRSPQRAA